MNGRTFEPADVAIVGGGIMGCATAWWLARKGARVAVFERRRIATEQSSRAWAFVRQQGRHEAELPLAAEANGIWAELAQRYGRDRMQFVQGGVLVPAETEEDQARIESGHTTASQFGLNTRILGPDQIKELIPELAGNWRSALFTSTDAHAEPEPCTNVIAESAKELSVRFYEHEPVVGIERAGGKISAIMTTSGRCAAPTIVLAAGVGTAMIARTLGIHLPIQIITSSVGSTVAAPPFTKVAMWGPRVAYRPRMDGGFSIGNGYRGVGADYDIGIESFRHLRHFLPAYRRNWRLLRPRLGSNLAEQFKALLDKKHAMSSYSEPAVNVAKVQANLETFRALFPHLGSITLQKMWAGRIDLTPDVIPIIDRPDDSQSLYIAAGFSGHGFALGPSIGKQLSEWIIDGKPSLELSAFRAARFDSGDGKRDPSAL